MGTPCGLRNGSRKVRYFTAERELALVDRLLGAGAWFDPCGDEESAAWRRCSGAYSIRRGEDALLLPWPHLPIFCNPAFRLSAEFLARGAAHAAEVGVPVLFVVPAQVGSAYWRELVWPHATGICMLNPRPWFAALNEDDGSQQESEHPTDIAAILYGGGVLTIDDFAAAWGERGAIVQAVRRVETPMVLAQPSLMDSHRPGGLIGHG